MFKQRAALPRKKRVLEEDSPDDHRTNFHVPISVPQPSSPSSPSSFIGNLSDLLEPDEPEQVPEVLHLKSTEEEDIIMAVDPKDIDDSISVHSKKSFNDEDFSVDKVGSFEEAHAAFMQRAEEKLKILERMPEIDKEIKEWKMKVEQEQARLTIIESTMTLVKSKDLGKLEVALMELQTACPDAFKKNDIWLSFEKMKERISAESS